VYIQTGSITASNFARSWPPSASANSLNHSLQVYLQTRPITATKFAQSLVLATGPGNSPAVGAWTGKMVRFGSRPIHIPDPELLGGPSPYPYPSTCGFCRVWLDPSVPVSGSPFRVCLIMVAVIYVTVMCKILTLVHHYLYWFHWQPLYSKQGETCSLLHPEVEYDQVFILHHL